VKSSGVKNLRPFLPCKNFDESKAFYLALGFSMEEAGEHLAIFYLGQCTFFIAKEAGNHYASNLMMQLIVEDVDAALAAVKAIGDVNVKHSELFQEAWGQVFYLQGPAEEQWHITQLKSV